MKTSKQPDLKAPRFTVPMESSTSKEFIDYIRKKVPQTKNFSDNEIRHIVGTFNKTLWQNVISNRDGVDLPQGIGRLFIGSCKKKSNVDFANTNKYGKVIQHKNLESDKYLAKIFFSTVGLKNVSYANHELWGFKACRNFTRSTSKAFRDKWMMYIKVDPRRSIDALFRQTVKLDARKANMGDLLLAYDEFEF